MGKYDNNGDRRFHVMEKLSTTRFTSDIRNTGNTTSNGGPMPPETLTATTEREENQNQNQNATQSLFHRLTSFQKMVQERTITPQESRSTNKINLKNQNQI